MKLFCKINFENFSYIYDFELITVNQKFYNLIKNVLNLSKIQYKKLDYLIPTDRSNRFSSVI